MNNETAPKNLTAVLIHEYIQMLSNKDSVFSSPRNAMILSQYTGHQAAYNLNTSPTILQHAAATHPPKKVTTKNVSW